MQWSSKTVLCFDRFFERKDTIKQMTVEAINKRVDSTKNGYSKDANLVTERFDEELKKLKLI